MAVQEQTPYIEHIANGVTTSFALGFVCDSADKLVVTVNDLPTNVGDWSFSGGSVVFQYPPLSEAIVKIWRNSPLSRSTTFKTYDNSLNPNSMNSDFDKIWLVLQELNVKNSFSDNKLQALLESLVTGNINGLPAEILARIFGDNQLKGLINIEAQRAYLAEINLKERISQESNLTTQKITAETSRATMAETGLQTQINTIGIGNKAYKTFVQMDADKANIAAKSKVTVTNDATESNNGDWQWDGSVFTKSAYDPLIQSKEFTESFVDLAVKGVDKKITNKPTENILNVVDGEGKLSMYLDSEGDLHLTGGSESVQSQLSKINDVQGMIDTKEKRENLAVLEDNEGNVYALFNANAELELSNLTQPVQSILNSDNISPKSNNYVHDRKGVISDSVQPYLLSCLSGGGIIAPMPFSQAPHQFTPPSGLINVKVTQGQRLIVDTVYQKDDGVVHPHILEFRNGFLGYRYILGLTPYYLTQDKYENPCIYGSHDLEHFELIDKIPQPFSERPIVEFGGQHAYNSDDFFAYDFYSGELLFCWRRTYDNVAPRNEIWGSRTKNGLDWAQEELIYDGKSLGGVLLSPSIIFNFSTGLFELFVVESTQSGWRIRKQTSPTLKNPKWVHATYFQAIPNANIWHLDVRYIGDKVYAIAHDDAMTGTGTTNNLYLGVYDESADEFTWSDAVLIGEHYDPYKATFTPIFDHENNSVAMQVLWSSRSGGDENIWKLYSSKSNSVSF